MFQTVTYPYSQPADIYSSGLVSGKLKVWIATIQKALQCEKYYTHKANQTTDNSSPGVVSGEIE